MIDLRSDTVTKPSTAMREAMFSADVGDDVYGEDPTVNRLEKMAAEMLGMEDAILVASGTQGNLLGVMSHCQRGDEYIVGQHAHTYKYEAGGAAVLGSIQPQPLDFESDGTLDLEKVAAVIKPDDFHFAKTRLLCLENTQGGKVLPLDYISGASEFARSHGLGIHLDGARIFNAAVKLRVDVREIAQHFDSVTFCLSKGLGAPVGAVLCGEKAFISAARRWRKMVGGGMRQAGVLAAAGIFALENHVARLEEDHRNAETLSKGLTETCGVAVEPGSAETNMVFMDLPSERIKAMAAFLEKEGILIDQQGRNRLVTHIDITADDIQTVIHAVQRFIG